MFCPSRLGRACAFWDIAMAITAFHFEMGSGAYEPSHGFVIEFGRFFAGVMAFVTVVAKPASMGIPVLMTILAASGNRFDFPVQVAFFASQLAVGLIQLELGFAIVIKTKIFECSLSGVAQCAVFS